MKREAVRIHTMRFLTRLRQLGYQSQNASADAAVFARSSLSRYVRHELKMPLHAVLTNATVLQFSPKVVHPDLELVPVAIREGNARYAVKVPTSGVVPAGSIVRGDRTCTPIRRLRITDSLNTNGSTNKRVSRNTNGMLPYGAYWGLPFLPHSPDGMLSEQAILCPAQSVCSPPQ